MWNIARVEKLSLRQLWRFHYIIIVIRARVRELQFSYRNQPQAATKQNERIGEYYPFKNFQWIQQYNSIRKIIQTKEDEARDKKYDLLKLTPVLIKATPIAYLFIIISHQSKQGISDLSHKYPNSRNKWGASNMCTSQNGTRILRHKSGNEYW